VKCQKCEAGELLERRVNKKGRARGKIFWGCNRYPDCNYAQWNNPLIPKPDEENKEAQT
jgi:DNA topoisomerase-1